MNIAHPRLRSARLPMIDIIRGIALIGVVIFHLTFDLQYFGVLPFGTMAQLFWVVFARAVAGTFVFLAGVSLVLAHGSGIRWGPFWRSTGVVILAAIGISAVTFFAIPFGYIFFGILHIIAVSRILGLAFLRAPVWVIVALALAIWIAPYLVQSPAFDSRWLAWIGFSQTVPLSMDLEPVFPWFGPFLLGMALARLGWLPTWSPPGAVARGLAWIGRHTLILYLIHQPILLTTLWFILRP